MIENHMMIYMEVIKKNEDTHKKLIRQNSRIKPN